jgi:hypothetical protein
MRLVTTKIMQTRFLIIIFSSLFFKGQAQTSITDKASDLLKTLNSLDIHKLRLGQYDTLLGKTSDFTFTNDSINPIIQAKLFKARGDLRLEQMRKKDKLIATYSRDDISDAEYSYSRASELDPSMKCSCLKQLKQLYKLDPFVIDNVEEKKRDIKRQISTNR